MYCPECGSSLLEIATGKISTQDEKLIRILGSERLNTSITDFEKQGWREFSLVFAMCFKCKILYLSYGAQGIYFDELGKITDEAITSFVAQHLSNKED